MADNYNINITNKDGIKLLTKDKKLTDDVTITIDESLLGGDTEEYDGSWETVGGFTAVFAETYATPADYVTYYSLDNGLTWNNSIMFVSNRLEMEDVVQIKFKVTYGYDDAFGMYVGGRVVCEELGVDIQATSSNNEIVTDNFILTQDINVLMGSAV